MEEKEFEYDIQKDKEFNPVKEQIGGKAAERVIWSTYSLNAAVKALKQGLPLKANPFIGKNTQLLKANLVYKRTEQELDDYIKCMEDPVYFATKCYLKNPEGGLSPVTLRDYQVDYLRHLQKNPFSIFLSCRQSGKCFSMLSTIKIKLKNNSQIDNKLEKINHYYIKDNIYNIPFFELYNLYCKQTLIWKCKYQLYKIIYKLTYDKKSNDIINILYKLISLIDYIDYHYIRKEYLIDDYKTIEEIKLNNIEILTDTGYKPLSHIMITKPFEIYTIELKNGYILNCADEHIVFNEDFNEVYVKDLSIGQYIQTDKGLQKIISLKKSLTKISMCDTTVNDKNHRFYSNGILSHNSTTTAIYCLWIILFNTDKVGLILSKSGPAGRDLLAKVKDMFLNLPYYLKIGVYKWNQSEISFDNNSSISTEAFSPTAGLGKSINFLILDEFAWCPPNDVEQFYNNIIPTITADSSANVCIMSTQNGFNLFYKLWRASVEGRSTYAPFKVDWQQVPDWDKNQKKWIKRTEAWHKKMVGILGSEEAFQYQYGTMFSASDKCLVSRECLADLRDKTVLWATRNEELYELYPYIILPNSQYLFFRPEFDLNLLKTGWFFITIDLAEGGGQDSTVFNIFMLLDKDHYYHCGRWTSNEIDLDNAALEFWLLAGQFFNGDNCIWSLEWNTYGALFYKVLMNLNENDFDEKSLMYRFNNVPEGIELFNFVQYKKGSAEETIIGQENNSKTIPGVRLTGSNKPTGCSLLKMLFEKKQIDTTDLLMIGELENFEDKNGNGTYKASFGHDDIIMTCIQIPLMQQTLRWKNFIEDFEAIHKIQNNINNNWFERTEYDIPDSNIFNQLEMFGALNQNIPIW